MGAGPGGLTAAMILLRRGFDVEIFERAPVVGGRNAALTAGDFTFDMNPTFLTMKFILDEMFQEAGKKSSDYLDFVQLEPMYRLRFSDLTLDVTMNREHMYAQLADYAPGSEEGFEQFLEKENERFEKLFPCLQKDHTSIFRYLNPVFLKALPCISPRRSLFEHLGDYFKDEKVRLAFASRSEHIGMSPWECPAFFSMLPFIEHKFGVYHVEGGLSEISKAMARVIEEEGGVIHLHTPVKRLVLNGKKVRGVLLENKRRVIADDVIISADFAHAMTHLLPYGALKKYAPEKLKDRRYSSSTFMLYLGLDTIYEDVPHHSVYLADDYKKNIDDIFKRKKLSHDFSFSVHNASVTDETLAPPGKSGLCIVVPVPNNESKIDWKLEKRDFRTRVLRELQLRTPFKDIEKHIEVERIITPADWERDLGVYNGAVFNLSHDMLQMFYFRPHNEFEELKNCYLAGGGTHPGSGLSAIYESGRITANLISKKYGVSFEKPSLQGEKGNKSTNA